MIARPASGSSSGSTPRTPRILEINPAHPLIRQMASRAAAGDGEADLRDAAWLLLDQARIVEGAPVPDPAAFAQRLAAIMARGLAASPATLI